MHFVEAGKLTCGRKCNAPLYEWLENQTVLASLKVLEDAVATSFFEVEKASKH